MTFRPFPQARVRRAVARAAAAGALCGAVSSCAAIWGFHDAEDRQDAAAENDDATTIREAGGDRSVDASGNDATAALDAPDTAPPRLDASDASSDGDADAPGAINEDAQAQEAGVADAAVCPGACAPVVPAGGWLGPFELYELRALLSEDGGPMPDGGPSRGPAMDNDAGARLPACGGEGGSNRSWLDEMDLHGGLVAPAAACSCSCGAPAGGSCSGVTATYYTDLGCVIPCARASTSVGTCTQLSSNGCGAAIHASFSATVTDGGACVPQETTTLPPAGWEVTARLCKPVYQYDTGICAGPCVPNQDPQFEKAFCIVYPADVTCPGIGYTSRRSYDSQASPYYASFSDGRQCTPCGCAPPSGVTCGTSVQTTTTAPGPTNVCTGLADASSCAAVTGATYATASATPTGGSCAPTADGGLPTGSVTPASAYTICCTQ